MRLFQRNQQPQHEPEHYELEVPCGTKRLVKGWDDERAKHTFSLEAYRPVPSYHTVLSLRHECNTVEHYWSGIATGDQEWAARTAEHYGLKMVEAER